MQQGTSRPDVTGLYLFSGSESTTLPSGGGKRGRGRRSATDPPGQSYALRQRGKIRLDAIRTRRR